MLVVQDTGRGLNFGQGAGPLSSAHEDAEIKTLHTNGSPPGHPAVNPSLAIDGETVKGSRNAIEFRMEEATQGVGTGFAYLSWSSRDRRGGSGRTAGSG